MDCGGKMEKLISVAIVDDEIGVCGQLESFIVQYAKEKRHEIEVDVFYSGEEILKLLDQNKIYDLILLDIELGSLNGVDVGKHIREKISDYTTQIAYISGKTHYAMKLFQISPIDFLEKPLTYAQVHLLMEKLEKITKVYSDVFSYKYGRDLFQVKIKDILYFKSNDRKVQIFLTERTDEFYAKLDDVHQQLHNHKFLCVHRSYIVNCDWVRSFQYPSLIMCDGTEIPIAQSKRSEVRKLQMKLEKETLQ